MSRWQQSGNWRCRAMDGAVDDGMGSAGAIGGSGHGITGCIADGVCGRSRCGVAAHMKELGQQVRPGIGRQNPDEEAAVEVLYR